MTSNISPMTVDIHAFRPAISSKTGMIITWFIRPMDNIKTNNICTVFITTHFLSNCIFIVSKQGNNMHRHHLGLLHHINKKVVVLQ